jgi:hypothetical protein
MGVTIYAVAIEFESSIIKYKVNSAACIVAQLFDTVPELMEVVTENVFLGRSEVVAAC